MTDKDAYIAELTKKLDAAEYIIIHLNAKLVELEKDTKVAKEQYQGTCDIIKELERIANEHAVTVVQQRHDLDCAAMRERELECKLAEQQALLRRTYECVPDHLLLGAGFDELNNLLAEAKEDAAKPLQAKIDSLMLEYYHDEMTQEQKDTWGLNQVVAPKPQGE